MLHVEEGAVAVTAHQSPIVSHLGSHDDVYAHQTGGRLILVLRGEPGAQSAIGLPRTIPVSATIAGGGVALSGTNGLLDLELSARAHGRVSGASAINASVRGVSQLEIEDCDGPLRLELASGASIQVIKVVGRVNAAIADHARLLIVQAGSVVNATLSGAGRLRVEQGRLRKASISAADTSRARILATVADATLSVIGSSAKIEARSARATACAPSGSTRRGV